MPATSPYAPTDVPFWSDGFDMDLPKIFPEARALLGDLADIELVTCGTPDARNGRLNHPAVWNGDGTMLSFFGFAGSRSYKPAHYHAGKHEIACTAWEAFRDCWVHHFLLNVELWPVWDTFAQQRNFEIILWDVRGWRQPADSPAKATEARRRAWASYRDAVATFRALVDRRRAAKAVR